MKQKRSQKSPVAELWEKVENKWDKWNKESSALAHGNWKQRIIVLALIVILIFLCFLSFSTDILSLSLPVFREVEQYRLTEHPYTETPTVTPTRRDTHTPTPTITDTPTGTLPKPSKTPIIFTATFTVTSTPTRPVVPLSTSRPESAYQWRDRLTDTWLWHHFYAVMIGVGLASWTTVLYLRDVYGLRRSIRSTGLLRRMILMLPVGTLHVKGGHLVNDKGQVVRKDWILTTPEGSIVRKNEVPLTADDVRRTLRLLRMGIPARLLIDNDSCAVIEGSQKQAIICGPTRKPVLLLGFSRLRQTIYLGDKTITLNVQQPTSDGIMLRAEDVQIRFSVYRGNRILKEDAYPYVEEAIFRLVNHTWLEGDWLPAMANVISTRLRRFISQQPIETFLPYLSPRSASTPDIDHETNPFNAFTRTFNSPDPGEPQCGIEIHWLGIGKWRLVTDIDLNDLLDKWLRDIDQLSDLPNRLSDQPTEGEFIKALRDLIHKVPLEVLEKLFVPDTEPDEKAILSVIMAYRDKLVEVERLYQQHNQVTPDELVMVINHLNRLIIQDTGGSG